jgi:DNA polymerase I-like protein with 3'-5' exonuclease and polymerase domains
MKFGEPQKLTPEHPLWDVFIRFHTGAITGDDRRKAKALLFGIHYGANVDASEAYAEIEKIRARHIRAH